MSQVRLPLFPLNVVLLPGADMPLHIFEPCYRQMGRDCLEAKSPFGMLLALPNGMAGNGLTAGISERTITLHHRASCLLSAMGASFLAAELFSTTPTHPTSHYIYITQ